jgi:putative nucleotidyltransferase with HDIG domain
MRRPAPMGESQPSEERPDQPGDAPQTLADLVLLLVDDDDMTRETLVAMVRHLGVRRVHEANSVEGAVEVLERTEVDVVMTDIHMPRKDGLALVREVKTRWPSTPVLVLTGYPTIEIAIDAMKRGASDFIMKPFRMEQIELPLQRALKERRLLLENSILNKELQQKKEIERLNEDLNRKIQELSVLYSISESFQSGYAEGEDLPERIVQMAADITDAKRASLMLVDEETNRLVIRASRGIDPRIQEGTQQPLGEGIAGKVAIEGKPLIVRNIEETDLEVAAGTGRYLTSSLISVPLLIRKEVFGVLNVADKKSGKSFREEELTLLSALAHKAVLAIENQALYESIYTTLTDTLLSLVSTIEARDPYTKDHSQRVTQWAVQIAHAMGLGQDEVDVMKFAGYLHDIGKIGIRDSILMKPMTLTTEEMSIIRTHPIIGERIVKPLGLMPLERSIIRHHHERWDGKGYPDGLQGEEIPLPARILAVADVFDAITSNRVYRKARPPAEALRELQRSVGSQFDRQVVLAFQEIFAKQDWESLDAARTA